LRGQHRLKRAARGKAQLRILKYDRYIIKQAVELADTARKGGLLALENIEIHNKFIKKGVTMMVDGLDQDVVKKTLQHDMDNPKFRS